ncbi:MAG: F0F1 ATP synthase subunit delta [Eubacteriales bacterium]|nr:F0F1 ATP synthase subunit delta [Eubacteriales bacterium]
MAELTVETTYGKALYEAARDTNKIDLILEEISQIRDLIEAEAGFREFLNTPVLAGAKKKKAVSEIFKDKVSPEVLNFLYILIDKRRTRNFGKIVYQYQKTINENNGISAGTITSVEPLTEEQLRAFEDKTGKLLRKNVSLENKVDASILGGVKIFIEGKIIDASVKKRLQDLEGSLMNVTL